MDSNRWREVSRIFNEAIKKTPNERLAFVAEMCPHDEKLQTEVAALVAAHESFDSFIDSPEAVFSFLNDSSPKLENGAVINSFEIKSFIGAGGMGEVYLAEDLRLNRQVALKFLSSADENSTKRFLREAKSAASLEHPQICTIHEIGEFGGLSYIVMQYIEGRTLSEILKNGKLPLPEALNYAVQIAEALAEAHRHDLIHRDIKPANIIVTPNNQIKVLDFGLAKKISPEAFENETTTQSMLSQPGLILGTASYMSPEQARGEAVDHRSDLWNLGVVLYEMTIGKIPFEGKSIVEKLVKIIHDEPEFPQNFDDELKRILIKSLAKDPRKRFQSADEMLAVLRTLRDEIEFEEKLKTHTSMTGELISRTSIGQLKPKSKRRKFSWKQLAFYGLLIGILLTGAYFYRQNSNLEKAKENLRRVAELAQEEKNFAAYDLGLEVEKYLPDDETLVKLMPTISKTLSVNSEPTGARVYLRRYAPDKDGRFPERELIGETPVKDLRVARGQYVLQIEKEGYARFERTISATIPRIGGSFIDSPPVAVEAKLLESSKVPEKMAFVPAGKYSLVNWSRPTQKEVELEGFFIDKYEVSNRDFKEFITSGGYLKKAFWKFPFVKNGREIPLEEAVKEFKDKTGLPAPRSWSNQNYPEGKDNFPVTDITWYEAAAYAEFREKTLPTVFQWEKAARDGAFDPRYNAMPWGFIKQGETTDFRANFSANAPAAVDAMEFGMSPFGVFNMAGNVSEWCLNRSGDNYVTSGGAWNDLPYSFGDYGEYPSFYTSDKLGFRCALNLQEAKGDQGAGELPPPEIPVYKISGEKEYKIWLTHYDYDKKPLQAQTVETIETDAWKREKITFTGENGEQAVAYFYLPKNYAQPLQTVHYIPPGDVVVGLRSLTDSVEMFLPSVLKSGRAVFAVVLKGYNERPFPANYVPPERSTVEFRKQAVNWMTDLRRGLDYLETRPEIDKNKTALLGISNGANLGLLALGVEKRYHSAVLVGVGVDREWQNWIPESNYINFAPHSKLPKLIINGRYDETHPLTTFLEPLYKIMSEPKKLIIYDGGHIPTIEFFATGVNGWLDEKLGVPRQVNLSR